jgi:hypothetical protein
MTVTMKSRYFDFGFSMSRSEALQMQVAKKVHEFEEEEECKEHKVEDSSVTVLNVHPVRIFELRME